MQRRGVVTLLVALLALPRPAGAAAELDLTPRPRPGLRLLLDLRRRREVFHEGRWVEEARSAASGLLAVRRDGEGLLFAWRWLSFGADEAADGRPADVLRLRMARLWEEVGFDFRLLPGRGPVLADPAAAQASVEAALERALSDIERELVAEGRPRGAVEAALAEVRRRFLELLAGDDRLAHQLLQEPALVFELAGVRIPEETRVAVHEDGRPLDFAPGTDWPMRVEDRLLLRDPEAGLVRLRRREEPLRPLDRRLLLERIPGLAGMWRMLPEAKRAEVLAALPPPFYARESLIEVDLGGPRLPRRIRRIETSGLGTLRRRLSTEVTVDVRDAAAR